MRFVSKCICESLNNCLDLVFELLDLLVHGTIRVSEDSRSHNVARDSACTTKVGLLWHVDINDVLMKSNVDWLIMNSLVHTKRARLVLFTLSSQRSGRCRMISSGSVSAASTTRSARPRLRALVVSLAPFFNYII